MDIKGQKGRVAGHIIDNIFYVVFLDREHRFYITEKGTHNRLNIIPYLSRPIPAHPGFTIVKFHTI